MDILHGIETKALALREAQPSGMVSDIPETADKIRLPMERPLYAPPIKPVIVDLQTDEGIEPVDVTALFSQVVIDRAETGAFGSSSFARSIAGDFA